MWQWLVRLFKRSGPTAQKRHPLWPSADEIAKLPWFEELSLDNIVLIETPAGARRAFDEITQETVVGFDTESKPTFVRGHVSEGPHVAQFASNKRAYVFPLHDAAVRATVAELIKLPTLKKVGFGLGDDLKRIRKKLHVEPAAVTDIGSLFARRGFKNQEVGVKVAMALVFKQRFRKSKRIATSNWKFRHLSDQQILYAANDAYAALRIYEKLQQGEQRR
jgi:ribonuclease D